MQSMPRTVKIRKATQADIPVINGILKGLDLPQEGITNHVSNFLVAEVDGKIVGTIGLEIYQQTGLLRSAAVLPYVQQKGVGQRLFDTMERYAKEQGVGELLLLTTTAVSYFSQKGFETID